jgi:CRISP-associated protein Cas1
MATLYLLDQGCRVALRNEALLVYQQAVLKQTVQLPTLERVLVFGSAHLTTPVIRACLRREVGIGYLSRQGRCYGRVLPIRLGYRSLFRLQQSLAAEAGLGAARAMVTAKIQNSRVLLLRSQRRRPLPALEEAITFLDYFAQKARGAVSLETLRGYEGAAAAQYFPAFGLMLTEPDFVMTQRSRRPPLNPVNALLSFGYSVLWNHLLGQIELQGLDSYLGIFHTANDRHPALTSDLLEEFRAPIIDSLVVWLINSRVIQAMDDFEFRDGGCFLNERGRRTFLKYFIQEMNELVQVDSSMLPRWALLEKQVSAFKRFLYHSEEEYLPYRIR